ncbi:MAG TPA: GAF domain-containing protein, partial [Terriglobales bacterium]|nr:GAF domain-containing protein [Terriglobales bacterium]
MNTRYSLDRESFEALLADAFAVQESGLDSESLSTLVEIQHFIASAQFDFNEEMRIVVDRVLKLSSADGVAIALIEANKLVYRAGAGHATKNVGRYVAAVLNVSSQDVRREILRVENAESDMRIEAEICRQFGARSMLMLPICENHALIGVLQILYNDAHSFVDREVLVYRLMVGALEEGTVRRPHHGEQQEMPGSVEQVRVAQGSSERSFQPPERITDAATIFTSIVEHPPTIKGHHFARALSKQCHAPGAVVNQEERHSLTRLRATVASTVNWSWSANSWRFGAALVGAVVLCMFIWLSNVNHPLTSTGGSTVPTQQAIVQPATRKPLLANQEPNPQDGGRRDSARRNPGFKRVWISPTEVDYIAEDVTIRRFTTRSARPQIQNGVKEVNVGDDVTVRYFA